MNRIKVVKTGLLALGTGSFIYFHHTRKNRSRVLALQKDETEQTAAKDTPVTVVTLDNGNGQLSLRLRQVQVMFRHGARTPIYTMPNVSEVDYEPEFLNRDHQESIFPYEKISCVDGSQLEWSDYEKSLSKRFLRGGTTAGTLTGVGREQTYLLGRRMRESYRRALGISSFDPRDIRILSSNVRRTVESAQGVVAGFYGKDELVDYAKRFRPVQIEISDPDYNILIPNTHGCQVLKKNNHSAMVHPDFLPGFKEQRLEVEAYILKSRQQALEMVTQIQSKLDSALQSERTRTPRLELNKHRQPYLRDPRAQPLFEERGRAIANIDRFWANVLNRDPTLRDIITESDMHALVYLRDLEVEKFKGTLTEGYRIHFYFDKNPYFHDRHLCKEVFTQVSSTAPPSRQTQINWKPGRSLFPVDLKDDSSEKADVKNKTEPAPRSFFQWFVDPTFPESDPVGTAITGDVWRQPLAHAQSTPKVSDHWDKHLHFVFGRDDTTARVTHGLPHPPEVRKFQELIDANATSILYYSLAGQTDRSRGVVTRLAAGPLLTEMVDQARAVVAGHGVLKLCLYSSHDSTLSSLLESLGLWNNEWPPFASDLRLELYQDVVDDASFFVRVVYNGKVQKIRGQSESFVRWEDFERCVGPYLIRKDEMEAVCASDILERIAQEVLQHEKDEVETEEIKEESETPAGM